MDCISLFEYLWLQSRAKVPFKSSVDNKVPIITIFKLRSVTVVSSNIFWIKFLAGMEMMQNKERSKVLVLHCPFIMPAKTFESLIVLPPYSASYQMLWTLNWADSDGKGSVTKSFASTLSTDVPLNFQSYPCQKLTGGFAYFLRIKLKLQEMWCGREQWELIWRIGNSSNISQPILLYFTMINIAAYGWWIKSLYLTSN